MKARSLTPELLDSLPPDHPDAQASRRDLRRLHPLLGQIGLWTRWLAENFPARPPASLADLGAGDGSLLGTVLTRAYPKGGHGARIFFVDRQPIVPESMLSHLRRCNWLPTVLTSGALEWVQLARPVELVLSNLFLHHLPDQELRDLFGSLTRITPVFASLEPARKLSAAIGCRLLPLLGCQAVTLHDARVSVQAGFRGTELSDLWPKLSGWRTREHPSGLFNHFFCADKSL